MSAQPAMQWYPGDHQRDNGVRLCSFEARGLWREMLDLMHFGEPRGHLTAGSAAISTEELARVVGLPVTKVRRLLAELEQRNVFSRTDAGVIYSRRMVRDEHLTQVRRVAGSKGGRSSAQTNADARGLLKQNSEHYGEQSREQTAPPAVCSLPSAVASALSTTTGAGDVEDDGLASHFTEPRHRDAYLGLHRAAQNPKSLDYEVQLVAEGGERPGAGVQQGFGWAVVGEALHHLSVNGGRPTPRALRSFCEGVLLADPPRSNGERSGDHDVRRLPTNRGGWVALAHQVCGYLDQAKRAGADVWCSPMAYDRENSARRREAVATILADASRPWCIDEQLLAEAAHWSTRPKDTVPFLVADYLMATSARQAVA